MANCAKCGQQYFPTSAAWGDVCGQCLASKIEDTLAIIRASERRPALIAVLRGQSGGKPWAVLLARSRA
jgi:hypothetical protein